MDSSRLKSQSREGWSQFVSLVTMDLKIAKNQKQRGKKGGGGKKERKKGRKRGIGTFVPIRTFFGLEVEEEKGK